MKVRMDPSLSRILRFACLGVVLAVCSRGFAQEPQAQGTSTVTVKDSNTDRVIFEVGVDGLTGDYRFKDFHLNIPNDPPVNPPRKLPPLNGTTVNFTGTDKNGNQVTGSFTAERTADGSVHLTIKEPRGGLPDGTYEFTINWSFNYQAETRYTAARACVTWNGAVAYVPGNLIGEAHTTTGQSIPYTFAGIFGATPEQDPITCARGAVTPLSFVADDRLAGRTFRIYSSIALAPHYEDELRIGINSETMPVPSEWGVTFQGFEGTLSATGGALQPVAVSIPAATGLAGSEFYVVLAVEDPEGGFIVVSDVRRLVIQ